MKLTEKVIQKNWGEENDWQKLSKKKVKQLGGVGGWTVFLPQAAPVVPPLWKKTKKKLSKKLKFKTLKLLALKKW